MKFRYFYEQYFLESAEDGDVMEGIFAIALALYIAYGNVDASEVDKVRRSMNADAATYIIDSNIADNPNIHRFVNEIDPQDTIKVVVRLALKKSAQKSFGPEHKTSKSVQNKIQVILDKAIGTKSVGKINQFIKEVLTNNRPDDVTFFVSADGMESGNKGGEVKGDVKIKIEAKTNTPVPEDITVPLSFSLKVTDDSSLPKFANAGIFDTMFQLAKSFRLPMVRGLEDIDKFPKLNTGWVDQLDPIDFSQAQKLAQQDGHFLSFVKDYFAVQSSFKSKDLSGVSPEEADEIRQESILAELQAVKRMYNAFLNEFDHQLEVMEDHKRFNDIVLNFLEKSIFGSDLADVITISNKDIKEIQHADFQKIRSQADVEYRTTGDGENRTMKFYDDVTGKLLFQIRPRIEAPTGKRGSIKKELAIEVGDLIYS